MSFQAIFRLANRRKVTIMDDNGRRVTKRVLFFVTFRLIVLSSARQVRISWLNGLFFARKVAHQVHLSLRHVERM